MRSMCLSMGISRIGGFSMRLPSRGIRVSIRFRGVGSMRMGIILRRKISRP